MPATAIDRVPSPTRESPPKSSHSPGVKPGDLVADFMPGNVYFTRILSKIVGPTGCVYNVTPEDRGHRALRVVAGAPERDADSLIEHPPHGQMNHPPLGKPLCECIEPRDRGQILGEAGRLKLGVDPA